MKYWSPFFKSVVYLLTQTFLGCELSWWDIISAGQDLIFIFKRVSKENSVWKKNEFKSCIPFSQILVFQKNKRPTTQQLAYKYEVKVNTNLELHCNCKLKSWFWRKWYHQTYQNIHYKYFLQIDLNNRKGFFLRYFNQKLLLQGKIHPNSLLNDAYFLS